VALVQRKKIESDSGTYWIEKRAGICFSINQKKVQEILSLWPNSKEVGMLQHSCYELVKTGQCNNCSTVLLVSIERGNYVGDDCDDCIGDDVADGDHSSKC